jgi:structural maintenance of chromosome 2
VRQRLGKINFTYSDPYPNFDRSKVKGPAASLLSLDEEHFNKATALEIAAGGKLFQVVVQDEKVGKDLLQKGGLRHRVTLIPLNKISARTLDQRVIRISLTRSSSN